MNFQIVAGPVLALLLVSSAAAEAPAQIFRQMLDTFEGLAPRQRPAPLWRGNTARERQPIPGLTSKSISSSKPTIDCSNGRKPLALILCSDENAARADWDVNAAAWAYAFSLGDDGRKAFWDQQNAWITSLAATCRLTGANSRQERECVVDAYKARARVLQLKLSGDALVEAKLTPEQRAEVQARLVAFGFLDSEPDGEFGPNTRMAIRNYQQANGLPEGAYLTAHQRQALLTSPRWQTTPQQQPPTSPLTGPPAPNASQLGQLPGLRFPTAPNGGVGTPLPGRPEVHQQQPLTLPVTAAPQSNASRPGQLRDSRFPTAPNSEVGTSLPGRLEAPQLPRTKIVKVTASGTTADEAWKEAARMAVQQVAGVFIDHRRVIESHMSDQKVTEIIEEKLLSYTNAYVSRFDVLSTNHESGNHTITAEVTVSIGPLLKTLQTN